MHNTLPLFSPTSTVIDKNKSCDLFRQIKVVVTVVEKFKDLTNLTDMIIECFGRDESDQKRYFK